METYNIKDKIIKTCYKGFCTCFFDRWLGVDIFSCCEKHDEGYDSQTKSKEVYDEELLKCIKNTVPFYKGGFLLSIIMWLGVRIGGYYSWNSIKNKKLV